MVIATAAMAAMALAGPPDGKGKPDKGGDGDANVNFALAFSEPRGNSGQFKLSNSDGANAAVVWQRKNSSLHLYDVAAKGANRALIYSGGVTVIEWTLTQSGTVGEAAAIATFSDANVSCASISADGSTAVYGNIHSTALMALDIATGAVSTLYDFGVGLVSDCDIADNGDIAVAHLDTFGNDPPPTLQIGLVRKLDGQYVFERKAGPYQDQYTQCLAVAPDATAIAWSQRKWTNGPADFGIWEYRGGAPDAIGTGYVGDYRCDARLLSYVDDTGRSLQRDRNTGQDSIYGNGGASYPHYYC